MEYRISTGFLLVLLIRHCMSEDISTIDLDATPSTPQNPEAPSDEVAPVVAPPNLRDVQQAVQEASEQVEGHGAKKVLKELLERVVEAALGHREGDSEVKPSEGQEEADEATSEADPPNADADAEAESLDHAVRRAGDGHAKDGVIGVKEEQMAEINAFGDVAGDQEDLGQGDTVVRDETAGGVETAGREADAAEVIDESLGAEVNQEDVAETAAPLKETGGDGAGFEPNHELLEEKVRGEALSTVRAEQKTEEFSLGADAVHPGEDRLDVEAQVTEQPGGEEPTVVEDRAGDVQAPNIGHGGAYTEADDKKMENADEAEGVLDIKKVSEDPPIEEGDGGVSLGTSHGPEDEDHEEAAGTLEHSLKLQTPIQASSPGEEARPENAQLREKHVDGNDIMTPGDDLLADSFVAEPTLDNYVKVTHPLEPGREPAQNNELVEETSLATEVSAVKTWKIGAIAAAAFLVLETVLIIVYIINRQNKNSARASRRSCEEGSLEPEAATGADCSDETLPASNGDTQQALSIDPSEAASALAQRGEERHGEQRVTNMENLPLGSTAGMSNALPGADISEQE